MKKNNIETFKANWSKKENDIMLYFPKKSEGSYFSGIFNQNFIKDVISMGYDITTLKFSIKKNNE